MKPVVVPKTNVVFTAEGCFDLPAVRATDANTGADEIETCWELSDDELEQIVKNKRVYLYVRGRSIPPVLLTVESILEEGEKNENS